MSAFISYSRKDSLVAHFIANTMKNHGIDVFIDTKHMDGGNFISNIGQEIKLKDYFVILISPNSVQSKWVQREASLAFVDKDDKKIIPVILQATPMENVMWPLLVIEQVDFTAWYSHQDMSDALFKLARLMNFTYIVESVADKPTIADKPILNNEADEPSPPQFSRSDISSLMIAAAEQQKHNPERAIYLYNQVLEISPNYLNGQAKEFINRQEEIVNPIRIENLLKISHDARKIGHWNRLVQLCNDILEIDENNQFAKRNIKIGKQNQTCEPIYQIAEQAQKQNNHDAVITFFEDIQSSCPHFGDPANLLTGYPIVRSLIPYVNHLQTIEGHMGTTRCAVFSQDEQLLASGGDDNFIRLWHLPSGAEHKLLEGHTGEIYSLSFSSDSSTLVSASTDKTMRVWDIASGKLRKVCSHKGAVYSVSLSHDGNFIASSSEDATIWIWQSDDLKLIRRLEGHTGYVRDIEFSPDDSLLASVSSDRTVRFWDTTNWTQVVKPMMVKQGDKQHPGDIYGLSFSNMGDMLASADNSRLLRIWDVSTGKQRISFNDNSTPVTFSSVDNYLLASARNRAVNFWDVKAGIKLRTFDAHDEYINSISFSPSGKFIVTTSRDWTIRLWGLG